MRFVCTDIKKNEVDFVKVWVKKELGREVDFEINKCQTVFCQNERYSIYADITDDEYMTLFIIASKLFRISALCIAKGCEVLRKIRGD